MGMVGFLQWTCCFGGKKKTNAKMYEHCESSEFVFLKEQNDICECFPEIV